MAARTGPRRRRRGLPAHPHRHGHGGRARRDAAARRRGAHHPASRANTGSTRPPRLDGVGAADARAFLVVGVRPVRRPRWTFGIYLFIIAYAVLLFLLAALLFPDSMLDYASYEDFFFSRRRWFFGAAGRHLCLRHRRHADQGRGAFRPLRQRVPGADADVHRALHRRGADAEPYASTRCSSA